MTYAIIKSGSRQYTVKKGEYFIVDSLQKKVQQGEEYVFDNVFLLGTESGVKIGSPTVENAAVVTQVKSHSKGKKIHIMKFKRRKSYLKRQGFRPLQTTLEVLDIKE